jgi:hypothetical protein
VLGIDTVQDSSGVAVAASTSDVLTGVAVVGATVGVIALLVYLVKALVHAGKGNPAKPDEPKIDPNEEEPSGGQTEPSRP